MNIIRLNSEVKTIDNQNIFEGNNLLCLWCCRNKSLALIFFLSAPVRSLRFCKCTAGVVGVILCIQFLTVVNTWDIATCVFVIRLHCWEISGRPSLQATLECLIQISSIILYHKNKPISEFDYFLWRKSKYVILEFNSIFRYISHCQKHCIICMQNIKSMKVTNMAGTVIYEESLYGNLYVIPIRYVGSGIYILCGQDLYTAIFT